MTPEERIDAAIEELENSDSLSPMGPYSHGHRDGYERALKWVRGLMDENSDTENL